MTILTAAIITVSTKGAVGKRIDESGPAIREALEAAGIKVVHTKLVSDGVTPVGNAIREASQKANVVITSGGDGAINELGARSRVQATGVGAPRSDSTVITASPMPSWVSSSSRS